MHLRFACGQPDSRRAKRHPRLRCSVEAHIALQRNLVEKAKTPRASVKKPPPQKQQAKQVPAPPVTKAASPKRKPQTRTVDKRGAFLAAYRVCASIKRAAGAAGINRHQHYDWLKEDADYHVKFRGAVIEAADALEDEAIERALRGVFEPNVFQGRFVYPQEEYVVKEARGRDPEVRAWRDKAGVAPLGIWKKSDALLMFLLRGFKPEKYKYFTQIEMGGPGGGPIPLYSEALKRLTDDELANLRTISEKLEKHANDPG